MSNTDKETGEISKQGDEMSTDIVIWREANQ